MNELTNQDGTYSTSPRRHYLDKPANWSDSWYVGRGGNEVPISVTIKEQRHDESGSISSEYEQTVAEGAKYRDLYNKYCKLVEAARRVCRVYIAQNEEDSEAEAVAALLDEI